jgi:putative selenium metabolism protein SsnA
VYEDGAVLIDAGRIAAVGASAELEARHPSAARLDAQGQLVTPGLVNAHMHLYSTFARGLAVPGPAPTRFTEILERLWWRLDRALTADDLYSSAVVPLCDGLRGGVTSVIDHHASPRAVAGSLDRIARACRNVGVRGVLCYETSDRDGPHAANAGIEENASFARECRGDPLVRSLFGLHASFTLSDATLARVALARGKEGIHIHVAEDAADEDDALARGGGRERVLDRLDRHGLLDDASILAHGVHLDDGEVALCARRRSVLVHNPQSNANNAVGWGAFTARQDAGVRVAIGSDGMTSAVLDEARMALLMARHELHDPAAAWDRVERALLGENPAIISKIFDMEVGLLRPGALADVVVWRYRPPAPLSPDGFLGHALFGLVQAEAAHVFVGGTLRLRDGVVLGLDEDAARIEARSRATALWNRF